MNSGKEKTKLKIFFVLWVVCFLITICIAVLALSNVLNDAIYIVIPALLGMLFHTLYRNSKKAIEENED